jgi:hypothetical protein
MWGYRRIQGELQKIGIDISATSIRRITAAKRRPGPKRDTWRQFMRSQTSSIIACDLFTVESVKLKTLHVLSFIELHTRRVLIGGVTDARNWAKRRCSACSTRSLRTTPTASSTTMSAWTGSAKSSSDTSTWPRRRRSASCSACPNPFADPQPLITGPSLDAQEAAGRQACSKASFGRDRSALAELSGRTDLGARLGAALTAHIGFKTRGVRPSHA